MKKTIIVLVILTILSLTLFIVINKKSESEEYKYNNVYSRVTNNYINNDLYSITTETITLLNGALTYESNIIYKNKSIKPISIAYISKYEEKQDRIITKTKTYYLDSETLCLESIDCAEPYKRILTSNDNKITKFKKKNYFTSTKKITPAEKGAELYVIAPSSELTKSYKKTLENIAYDFDIKIYTVELTKKNKKELTEKYSINETPTIVLYVDGELKDTEETTSTHEQIALYLFLRGIDYR